MINFGMFDVMVARVFKCATGIGRRADYQRGEAPHVDQSPTRRTQMPRDVAKEPPSSGKTKPWHAFELNSTNK